MILHKEPEHLRTSVVHRRKVSMNQSLADKKEENGCLYDMKTALIIN